MNNAQKKMREEAAPTIPVHNFDPSGRPRPSTPAVQCAEVDKPESPLFFPWDEEVERKASKEVIDEVDVGVISGSAKRRTKSLSKHISSAFLNLRPEETTTGLTTSALSHSQDQNQDHVMRRSTSVPVQVLPIEGQASTTLHHQPEPGIHSPPKQQVDESGHQSLDDQMIDTDSAAIIHPARRMMVELHTGDVFGPGETLNDPLPLRHPPSGLDPRPSFSAERQKYLADPIDPSLKNIPLDEIVISWNGTEERHWRKGDLVLELFMERREVGDTKVLGIPWALVNKIIRLKDRNAHKLRIDFEYRLDRSRYNELSRPKWFSTLARGPVEPFTDTKEAMSSLANHMEIHDLAAIWNHPHHDIMLVLYSCRSPEWQDLGQAKPRFGDTRLQILIRQKFRELDDDHKRISDEKSTRELGSYGSNENRGDHDHGQEERQHKRRESPPAIKPRSRRSSIISSPEKSNAVYTVERDRGVRPTTDVSEVSTTKKQDNVTSPVFERDLASLITPPTKLSDKYNKRDVWVLFACKGMNTGKVEAAIEWLVAQGFPSNRILDKSSSGSWTTLATQLREKSIGIIIFDKNYEFYQLGDLGKCLENSNLLCWQTDFSLMNNDPLQVTRLFPYGTVMAICEGAFIEEPDRVLTVLKWFKKASAAAPHHKLMIAPNIRTTLQDQAMLARKPQISQLFLDAASIIEELVTSSTLGMLSTNDLYMSPGYDSGIDVVSPSGSPTSSLHSILVMPSWADVYKDVPESAHTLPPFEQRSRAENVDKLFVSYFAAWAQRHVTVHRSFIAVIIGSKKQGHEHVRQCQAKEFLLRYAMGDKEKETPR